MATWSPSGALLAFSGPGAVEVWDAARQRLVARVPVHTPYGFLTQAMRWSSDGRSLLVDAQPGAGHD
jgi:hypothetical protein